MTRLLKDSGGKLKTTGGRPVPVTAGQSPRCCCGPPPCPGCAGCGGADPPSHVDVSFAGVTIEPCVVGDDDRPWKPYFSQLDQSYRCVEVRAGGSCGCTGLRESGSNDYYSPAVEFAPVGYVGQDCSSGGEIDPPYDGESNPYTKGDSRPSYAHNLSLSVGFAGGVANYVAPLPEGVPPAPPGSVVVSWTHYQTVGFGFGRLTYRAWLFYGWIAAADCGATLTFTNLLPGGAKYSGATGGTATVTPRTAASCAANCVRCYDACYALGVGGDQLNPSVGIYDHEIQTDQISGWRHIWHSEADHGIVDHADDADGCTWSGGEWLFGQHDDPPPQSNVRWPRKAFLFPGGTSKPIKYVRGPTGADEWVVDGRTFAQTDPLGFDFTEETDLGGGLTVRESWRFRAIACPRDCYGLASSYVVSPNTNGCGGSSNRGIMVRSEDGQEVWSEPGGGSAPFWSLRRGGGGGTWLVDWTSNVFGPYHLVYQKIGGETPIGTYDLIPETDEGECSAPATVSVS